MSAPSRHSGWTRESSPGSSCISIAPTTPLSRKKNYKTFQLTCKNHRNVMIVSVISNVIFIITIFILGVYLLYYQGRSVPSNHQKDDCCPPDWIGHQGHCYKLSREEKNWKESENFCMLHNASLAKITDEETEFVTTLTRNQVFWIGLMKEPDQLWKWPDRTNATLKVLGNGGDCAILNDDATASAWRCSAKHRYICKKK